MMSVRSALDAYFDVYLKVWAEKQGSLPTAASRDGVDPDMYAGQTNDADWFYWRPIRMESVDLTELRRTIGSSLHPSVEEYLGAYYFLDLSGLCYGRPVQLDPIALGRHPAEVAGATRSFVEEHGATSMIPIGFETLEDVRVVVDNDSGCVLIELQDDKSYETLSGSIEELIEELTRSFQQDGVES